MMLRPGTGEDTLDQSNAGVAEPATDLDRAFDAIELARL
jgi:hypothetical protein